ncbi:HGGxSTG domain-containing protein [Pseudomonas sp. CCI3.2]|uniref:HGGxSTG domain-containing protein n=1 Tax=unclassified Pseudomonas TaxID=196821 RepID=UPI002B228D37|nr:MULTISPECIES: HGGxSTG domain-containing protein [unclassified Pseudomonas]MEB0078021.1 HGGxSTG domain-containing protein [Pseudomonas sp. MH10out]MEB0104028.1 HGGxSTG domain-containing protein [Pseudomonas sp. CCI3.2]MEB0133557.1 HGGxSTG domain-containing protein [Pseudomonas sp. CCI2.4]
MALCGASKRGNGEPCKRHAIPGSSRCKLHGGKSTGPKDASGNQNAKKHGIYSQFLTDEEKADFDSADLEQIDDELRLTKVLLGRVLLAVSEGHDLLADRYLGRIESLTRTKEDIITKRLTNEKLRRELEDPNKGLPDAKQVYIGVEDASRPEAE